MFSGFIHPVAWVRTDFLFVAEYYSVVWLDHTQVIHPWMNICIVSMFGLLRRMVLQTLVNKFLHGHMFSFSLGRYMGVEFRGIC